jgi:hypothetical protein
MAIPTNYTYETFADYLRDEVLLDTAMELGWMDVFTEEELSLLEGESEELAIKDRVYVGDEAWAFNSAGFATLLRDEYRVAVGTTGTTVTLNEPAPVDIPDGTIVSFSEGAGVYINGNVNRVVDGAVAKGATTMDFTTSAPAGYGYFYVDYVAPTPPTRRLHPSYKAITDNTLYKLGETDIVNITGLNAKRKLRLYGRRETWYMAMQAVAADYDYSSYLGGVSRYQMYQHCKQMYEYEASRVDMLYGNTYVDTVGQYLTSTARSKIKVRW